MGGVSSCIFEVWLKLIYIVLIGKRVQETISIILTTIVLLANLCLLLYYSITNEGSGQVGTIGVAILLGILTADFLSG